jgi:hypothetical protein
MTRKYAFVPSTKSGLEGTINEAVVSEGAVYLRLVRKTNSSEAVLMTATTGEDGGVPRKCVDQIRLIAAAVNMCAKHGAVSEVEQDWANRFYVIIARSSNLDVLRQSVSEYFDIFDSFKFSTANSSVKISEGHSDLNELYDALSIDDSGGDVYVSDGVWISSDGSIKDLGR